MKKIIAALIIVSSTLTVNSQISTPRPSPLSTVTQKVGLTEFSVTYSRPSAKDRKVFGGIVAYDKLWRTGANMATVFKADTDFKINNEVVPAGEYALFTIPGEASWTIILSKNPKQGGTSEYKQEEDQIRFSVKPMNYASTTESFTIQFANLRDDKASVQLIWENTLVSFDVNVSFDEDVMKQIEKVMAGPSAGDHYSAASYYYKNGKDLNKALAWVNKALESGEKYWVMSLKAQIQAGLEDYKGAVATATKAKELATADEDDAYAKMNAERIAEWSTKKGGKK